MLAVNYGGHTCSWAATTGTQLEINGTLIPDRLLTATSLFGAVDSWTPGL